jgi:replication factor C subunit 1
MKSIQKKLSKIVGNQFEIQRIKDWLQNFDNEKKKGYIIYGPPGTGKTMASKLLLLNAGIEPVEINSTNSKGHKKIIERIDETIRYRNIFSYFDQKRQRKGVILDEFDVILSSDKMLNSEIKQLFINSQKNSIDNPIVFVCDSTTKVVKEYSKYCEISRFSKIQDCEIEQFISCSKKYKWIPEKFVKQIIKKVDGDFRFCMAILKEFRKERNSKSIDKTLQSILDIYGKHDPNLELFDIVSRVICDSPCMTVSKIIDYTLLDSKLIPLIIHENYLSLLNKFDSKKSIDNYNSIEDFNVICNITDSLCISDNVNRYIYTNQTWDLFDIEAFFSSCIPVHELRKLIDIQKFSQTKCLKFTCMISKLSTCAIKKNVIKNISEKMKEIGMLVDNNPSVIIFFLGNVLYFLIQEKDEKKNKLALKLMKEFNISISDLDGLFRLYNFAGQKENVQRKYTSKMKNTLKGLHEVK